MIPHKKSNPTHPARMNSKTKISRQRKRRNAADEIGARGSYLAGDRALHPTSDRTRAKTGRAALSDYQLGKAARRYSLLRAALPLLQKKRRQVAVAAVIGVSATTLSRLLNLAPVFRVENRENFSAAEKCRRLLAAGRESLAPGVAKGQRSPFTPLLRNSDIVAELKRLYVNTLVECPEPTADRRPGSIALALKRLGDFPIVPPRLASKLQSGVKPKPLVVFLKRTYSPDVAAKLRHYSQRIATGKVRIEVQSNGRQEIWLHDRRMAP